MAINCPPAGETSGVPLGFVFMHRRWNSARENNWRIWLKMLHTALMVDSFLVRNGLRRIHFNLPEAPPVSCSARRYRRQVFQKPNLDGSAFGYIIANKLLGTFN